MTHEDLKKLSVFQTKSIAEACKDETTQTYVLSCLHRFFKGDYGEIGEEDTAANNADLEAGDGHILARYGKLARLESDIYIEAMIYTTELENIDYNYIMIMYSTER